MMMRNVYKSSLRLYDPIICSYLSTRITETTFTGMSDIVLCSTFFAFVQTISEFIFVSAVHHFFHIFFYSITNIVYT